MTVVEKAAYLKGLTEGLGIAPDSKEGKLWNALNELLSDMAHEIEDLHACYDEHDEALDEVCDELNYLEELTCDLDFPEDDDDYDDFLDEEEDEVETAIREDIETILKAGFMPQGGVSALITPEYTTCYSQAFFRKK